MGAKVTVCAQHGSTIYTCIYLFKWQLLAYARHVVSLSRCCILFSFIFIVKKGVIRILIFDRKKTWQSKYVCHVKKTTL